MTDARSQPTTEHTPTPWRVADGEIWSSREDGSPDLIVFEPAGWRHWMERRNLSQETLAANAAFIVEAVNNYASLRSQVEQMRKALEDTRNMIRGELIENAVVNVETMKPLGAMIDAALSVNSQHSDGEAGR